MTWYETYLIKRADRRSAQLLKLFLERVAGPRSGYAAAAASTRAKPSLFTAGHRPGAGQASLENMAANPRFANSFLGRSPVKTGLVVSGAGSDPGMSFSGPYGLNQLAKDFASKPILSEQKLQGMTDVWKGRLKNFRAVGAPVVRGSVAPLDERNLGAMFKNQVRRGQLQVGQMSPADMASSGII